MYKRQLISDPAAAFPLDDSDLATAATGVVFAEPNGRDVYLVANGLPPLPQDQHYQVWLFSIDDQTVSAGQVALHADGEVRASREMVLGGIVVGAGTGGAALVVGGRGGAGVGARTGAPRMQQRGARRATRLTEFRARGQVQVALREIEGLGHAWSGGAPRVPYSDPTGPDATALVWAFMERQFASTP